MSFKWDSTDIQYGPDTTQKLDIIIPVRKIVHAIVYIHGGAYFKGDKSEYPSFLTDYSENNILVAMNYRLIEGNNNVSMGDILSDVNRALLKIIDLANEKGVSIKDFILVGHSAGGHIVLLYAYNNCNEKINIATCISMAGPTDFSDDIGWSSMTTWGEKIEERLSFLSQMGSRLTGHAIELTQYNWTQQKNYSEFKKYIMEVSPISYLSKGKNITPTLLIHGRSDNQVPYSNAVRLKTGLDELPVPNKLITAFGSANNHMLGGIVYKENSPFIFENQPWVEQAREWIEKCLD